MNTENVKTFLALRSQLWDEYNDLERQMEELQDQLADVNSRHTELENILNGYTTDIIDEAEEEPEPEPTLDDLEVKLVGEAHAKKNQRNRIDKAVVRFIAGSPGARRADIAEGLKRYDAADIERALKRCRNSGKIISEGRARAARWHVV